MAIVGQRRTMFAWRTILRCCAKPDCTFIGNEEKYRVAANFLQQGEIIFWRDMKAAFALGTGSAMTRADRFRTQRCLACVFG